MRDNVTSTTPQPSKFPEGKSEFEARAFEDFTNKGWRVLWRGWPDFLCVKNGRVVFVELKQKHDRLSEDQRFIIETFQRLGLKVVILRPDNYDAVIGNLAGNAPRLIVEQAAIAAFQHRLFTLESRLRTLQERLSEIKTTSRQRCKDVLDFIEHGEWQASQAVERLAKDFDEAKLNIESLQQLVDAYPPGTKLGDVEQADLDAVSAHAAEVAVPEGSDATQV
jgi:hypothetical protein